jgi:hypothetical protein
MWWTDGGWAELREDNNGLDTTPLAVHAGRDSNADVLSNITRSLTSLSCSCNSLCIFLSKSIPHNQANPPNR